MAVFCFLIWDWGCRRCKALPSSYLLLNFRLQERSLDNHAMHDTSLIPLNLMVQDNNNVC